METMIWGAVAVALIVLAKVLRDMYQAKQQDSSELAADDYASVNGMPVVPRAQRRHLPQVAVEPSFSANDASEHFAANEEMETVRFTAQAIEEPVTTSNVVNISASKEDKVDIVADETISVDDDFVDTLAMSASQSKVVEAQDYIIVYVTSGRVPFDGERLLKSVSNYGLRFGEMGMFHRHEHPNGHGQVLFSMARVDEVGAFDLEAMGAEFITAVTLFMALPNQQPYLAYDMMIDTAKRLAHEFCGQVLDQNQNPLNRQLIEHYREQVVEFTRHKLMSKAV
ncbi:cell division protein ZipA [Agitococcus lubricus]|uniref:Cell division protein ZipA n=1 Tax=Agitococcus lubricus TaxID=1077255 RepID=A0A2T5IZV9_9GAMM|nr:cell division protein ZipA [Agitococcus lubricus]PTQ89575.1 cell division protein ZipA [Agitococcus lubricus]